MDLPISEPTWQRLIEANQRAAWVKRGVFATGVGGDYWTDKSLRLLYVGKSAGPLSDNVAAGDDHRRNAEASACWMHERRNRRAFWQFVEQLDESRRRIAWTNVCKMDRAGDGGNRPPTKTQWREIMEPCLAALVEEIHFLRPRVIVFATSRNYRSDIHATLLNSGFHSVSLPWFPQDGWTQLYADGDDTTAILTKHPQGWKCQPHDRVIKLIEQLLQ